MNMKQGKCPECGSTEVRSRLAESHEIAVATWNLNTVHYRVYVCVDCGVMRTYIEDRAVLGKISEKWEKVWIES